MVQWTALRLKQSEHNSDWKLLTNITKRPRQDSRKKNSLSARKCTTFVVFSSLPRNLQFNVTAKNNKYAVALKIGLDLSRMYELRGYVEIIVLRICFRISIFDIRRAKKHKSPHQFFHISYIVPCFFKRTNMMTPSKRSMLTNANAWMHLSVAIRFVKFPINVIE